MVNYWSKHSENKQIEESKEEDCALCACKYKGTQFKNYQSQKLEEAIEIIVKYLKHGELFVQ